MRTQFRKTQVQMKKWQQLPPSGAARKTGKPPKPYKYAAEMAFLADIFNLETTEESYTSKQATSELDSNVCLLRHIIVQKVMNLSMFTDYINRHCQSTEPSLTKYLASCSRNCLASMATRPLSGLKLRKVLSVICTPGSVVWRLTRHFPNLPCLHCCL